MSSSGYQNYRTESESLVSEVTRNFTPNVVRSASSFSGESESSTSRALFASAPTVLAGLANMASSSEGAGNLTALVRDGNYGGLTDNPMSLFRGGSATNYLISAGQRHLGKIFGGDTASVVEAVGKTSGVSASSATKLLALTAPLTLGVLGKRAQSPGSSGVVETLLQQKDEITTAAPAGLSRILGFGPRAVPTTVRTVERETIVDSPTHIEHFTEPTPAVTRPATPAPVAPAPVIERPVTGGGIRWLPFALLIVAAIALLGYLLSRSRAPRVTDMATRATAPVTNALARLSLPGGVSLSVSPGSINYKLANFLGDKSATDLPRTFVFDHLNFESASTQVTPDSEKTVSDLAQVLKAYPDSQVQVTGHTDNTGNAQDNQTLSLNRANAVKAMLVNDGVSADRISTQGYGEERPLASNDTDEGRAQNRRIELTVTKK